MNWGESLSYILLALGGLGVFLFGLTTMSDSLESFTGNKLRAIFEKLTGTKFKGMLLGAGSTAIIQSSSATTVIVVGFVNAGLISLSEAVPVIMGANIGTTITALIMSLPITEFIAAAGCVAAFIKLFSKSDCVKRCAVTVIGLALIFVGLMIMSKAMEPFGMVLQNFFAATSNPILLLLIGMVFTALIQSSSAATGILIALAGTAGANGAPVVGIDVAMFVLLGVNIGTCITAFIVAIGVNINAKRAAIIHVIFNLLGAILFLILLVIPPVRSGVVRLFELIPDTKIQIAVFHIVFNVVTTAILLPMSGLLVRLSQKLIKEKSKPVKEKFELKYVNDLILSSPSLAVAQIKKEITYMASLAKENYNVALNALTGRTLKDKEIFYEKEEHINFLNRKITEYLVHIGSMKISVHDEKIIGTFFHVVSDIERIGDYAENMIGYTEKMLRENIVFSEAAIKEITDMYERTVELYELTMKTFGTLNRKTLALSETVENQVDDCKRNYSEAHIKRLNAGACTAQNGQIFFSLISNIERIADHMNNIGKSILAYTDTESFK